MVDGVKSDFIVTESTPYVEVTCVTPPDIGANVAVFVPYETVWLSLASGNVDEKLFITGLGEALVDDTGAQFHIPAVINSGIVDGLGFARSATEQVKFIKGIL